MNLKELYSISEKDFANLGNGVTPTESDLEKFEKWKKRKRNGMLITCIYSLFILVLVGSVLIVGDIVAEARLIDKIFGIMAYLLFGWAEIHLIKQYLKARLWKMEYCNYGKVIDKYCLGSSSRKNNRHIIVLVNGKKISINTCSISDYRKMQLNDEVIIFAVDNKKLYSIRK